MGPEEINGATVEDLEEEEKRLGEAYKRLSRERMIKGDRTVDEECRKTDVLLWLVRQQLKRRGQR